MDVQQKTMSVQQALEHALSCHKSGKLAEAEVAYQQVLKASPELPDALNLLGALYHQTGHYLPAIQLLERAVARDDRRPEFYLNYGAALDDSGRPDDAIAAYHTALALKPDYAKVLANLGNTLRKRGRIPEAINVLERAVKLAPDSASAHNNFAAALQSVDVDRSISHYRMALALRPDFAEAFCGLGAAFLDRGNIEEATAACLRALELRPGLAQAHNNFGNAVAAAGELDRAMASFQQAVKQSPEFAMGHWNLGLMYLLRGDFERGWPEYEWRLSVKEFTAPVQSPQPMWDGSDLTGKRLLIYAEQGIGDMIQFIRLLPQVAERGGRNMVIVCRSELHRLLRQVPNVQQWVAFGEALPEHDLQCPLLSLPRILGLTMRNIPADTPYLKPDPELSSRWRERMPEDQRLKVGLAWRGGPKPLNRSVPTSALAPLASVGNLSFYSLQKQRPGERADAVPFEIADWTSELGDFAETAALIHNLDLVITVDTAVAHLAGAMGKKTWVLLKKVPDWRWLLDRADSPWYPTMRLFRQPRPGDWATPIAHIVEALQAL